MRPPSVDQTRLFNTSMPLLDKYCQMLEIWLSCRHQYRLCDNKIKQILNA
ncbi:YfbU family protein [Vibrio hepatarius]|nr:YfbU family protein [Vibrio hepatarius]